MTNGAVAECFLLVALSRFRSCHHAIWSFINRCDMLDNPNHATLFQSIFILRGTRKACSSELSNYTLTNPLFNPLPWETDLHLWIKASNATSSQKKPSKCITADLSLLKWLPWGRSPSSTSFSSCIQSGTAVCKLIWQYFCCVKMPKMQKQLWKVKRSLSKGLFIWRRKDFYSWGTKLQAWLDGPDDMSLTFCFAHSISLDLMPPQIFSEYLPRQTDSFSQWV